MVYNKFDMLTFENLKLLPEYIDNNVTHIHPINKKKKYDAYIISFFMSIYFNRIICYI